MAVRRSKGLRPCQGWEWGQGGQREVWMQKTAKEALPDLPTPAGTPGLPDSCLAVEWPSHCSLSLFLRARYKPFPQSGEDFRNPCNALTAPRHWRICLAYFENISWVALMPVDRIVCGMQQVRRLESEIQALCGWSRMPG